MILTRRLIAVCFLLFSAIAGAEETPAVKDIIKLVQKIDSGHKGWTSLLHDGNGDRYQFWRNDEDPPLGLVREDLADDHGPLSKTYYLQGDAVISMTYDGEYIPMVKNPTATRTVCQYYFVKGELVHAAEKVLKYPASKPGDISKAKAVPLTAEKLSENASQFDMAQTAAQEILQALENFHPHEAAPTAPAVTTGSGWRMIDQSVSRDGKFALGWGIEGQEQPEGKENDQGRLKGDPKSEGLANYVVSLHDGSIIGKTEGRHANDADTDPDTGHNVTVWAESSTLVAQMTFAGLDTTAAKLHGRTNTVSPGADFLAATEKAVTAAYKGKQPAKDARFLRLHDVQIAARGAETVLVVGITVWSQGDGEGFDGLVTFTVTPGEGGSPPALAVKSTEFFAKASVN